MTSLTLILAPLFALQATGEAPVAIENDTPETWTLEYPRIIQPFVADYRRCLGLRMRRVTGQANFEMQHRSDIPACSDEFQDAVDGAKAVLTRRGETADFTTADVSLVFEHIGRIHIARGADLDNQFTYVQRLQESMREDYEADRPKGLVLELHDASVVKARTDATAAAAEAAYENREARGVND